jgi:signal transduction histidine kinase
LHQGAWIAAIILFSGLFTFAISLGAFYNASALVTSHGMTRQTALFIQSLDQSLLSLTSAETAERGFRLTGQPQYQTEFIDAMVSYESARDSLSGSTGESDPGLLQSLVRKMNEREMALDAAMSPKAGKVLDDPNHDMTSIRTMNNALRQVASAQLKEQSSEATTIEQNTSTRLVTTVALAILCIIATVVVTYFQSAAKQKITRRLQMERLNAVAANRTKSSFLAYTSHELRTPLNAIIGFSEFMMMEYAGPLTDRQKQYLNDIRGSGLHLQALISDILDLTKAEAGKITLADQEIDVPQLIDSCMRLIEGQAKEKNIAVKPVLDTNLPRLRGDELRCKQILINVAINAIQLTPNGGEIRLTVQMDSDGSMLFIVQDSGPGIPNEDIPKIIEPYFRSGIDEPSHKGYGIGVPLARKIAELHGGSLTVHSEIGEGTTVTVMLPANRMIRSSETMGDESPSADVIVLRPKLPRRTATET